MANLGPQRINLSYDGLLQVPNGITAVLQSVTDGNGNSTGLQISTTGFGGQITSDGVVITGGTINGTTIGATNAAAGNFTTLNVSGTTTLGSPLSGILKGSAGIIGVATGGTDYVSPSVLGAANGVATLGSDSKLTASQVPAIAVTEYLGAVASQAAMLALTGQEGDWCTRTDLGTNWIITGANPAVLSSWTQLSYPTAPVTSVNTQTGAVSLSYSDVGAAPATTGSSILYANGSGGFSNVTIGTNLSFFGGTLSATTTGVVTSLSVASSNGFAGTSSGGATPILTLSTTVSGLLKGNGTAISAATAGTDYQSAITATGILKGAGSGTVSSAVSGTDYSSGTSALATGILKSTTSTGALSIALVGTDYAPATTGTAILKGNGLGGFSNATSGTDYAPATSGTSLLKGNGSGGFSNATSGTDYAPATSGTSILYGSGSGGFSNVTVGSGLTFAGGTLAAVAGGGGTVTDMSVVTANGFAGIVATSTTTPAVTLTTTITGVLKGNGTAISAAVSGTDYAPATSGTALLKGNGAGGFSSAAAGTDYLAPPSGTAILKANSGGALANATAGTDYSAGTSALATGILKSTTSTGALSIAASGTDYAPATSGSSILYGNGSGGFSNVTIGTNLTFSAGTLSAGGGFASGTVMLFVQTAAPTGWTKSITHNDKALRVVSGTASSGGSVAFTTAFASQTPAGSINTSGLSAGATTLSTTQIPAHAHSIFASNAAGIRNGYTLFASSVGQSLSSVDNAPNATANNYTVGGGQIIQNTGGGSSHTHTVSGSATFTGTAINLAVQYVDVIIATKD